MKQKSLRQRIAADVPLPAAPLSILVKGQDENLKAFKGDSGSGSFEESVSTFEGETALCSEGEEKRLVFFQTTDKTEAFFKAVSEGKMTKMTEAEANDFRRAHGFECVGLSEQ
jgi:hypothetical protein